MRSTDSVRAPSLMLVLMLTACGGAGSNAGAAGEGGTAEGGAAGSSSAAPAQGRHLGLFFADGTPEFESCDGTVVPVDGPVVVDLLEMHAELTPGLEPLEALFVDVWGEMIDDGSGPVRLDALELRRVAYEGGGCARDDSRVFFRGNGTEPFWSLEIGEDGMVWTTPETTERMPHSGLYDGPMGEWIFDGLDSADAPILTATILQTPCVNAMSGAWSHLSMEIERDGESFSGCAYLSPDAEGETP